jgi:predicted RNase H-like HicB family nuclease
MRRQIVIHKDETGGYWVECPSLPGCISQGETIDETIANIKEAIELYIESLETRGLPIPEETYDQVLVVEV